MNIAWCLDFHLWHGKEQIAGWLETETSPKLVRMTKSTAIMNPLHVNLSFIHQSSLQISVVKEDVSQYESKVMSS